MHVSERVQHRQAELITELRSQLDKLARENSRLAYKIEAMQPSAVYYDQLQQMVLHSDLLMTEWQRFIAFARLSTDFEDRFTDGADD